MSLLKQSMALLVLSVVLGLVSYYLHPSAPKWDEEKRWDIVLEKALAYEGEMMWVDARGADDFNIEHIPNAIMLNEDDWDNLIEEFLYAYKMDSQIVVYCSSVGCRKSHSVGQRLRDEYSIENVYVLEGGWEAWQKEH